MQILYALDLTELPGAAALWRPRQRSVPPGAEAEGLLPRDGFASPMGFWFAPAGSWAPGVAPLRVEVMGADELARGNPHGEAQGQDSADLARIHRARLELPARRGRGTGAPSSAPGSLNLEIDARTARVGVDASTWPSVASAVLLVIAQYWRLLAIERALVDLNDWARDDIEETQGARQGVLRRRRSSQLQTRRRQLQAIILDLPRFEGPLTDPGSYLPQGRPVRIYRALAARLGLGRRRRLIDEQVEVIEAVLDSLVDSLDHSQALLFQVVLELIIVAVLLLDIVLHFLG
jgi:hypothetical protein